MPTEEEQIAKYCAEQGWTRTGVFATANECERARRWAQDAANAPVAKVHGTWLHEAAEAVFKRLVDDLAKAYGLPDRGDDHYGLTATGEFIVQAEAPAPPASVCALCGKPKREWQIYCGAACSARAEAGKASR